MRVLLSGTVVLAFAVSFAFADPDPTTRTADLPDSWLILYNLDDVESVAWAEWYQVERGIPAENMLGLYASGDEHLPNRSTAEAQIIDPVEDYFAAHPEIEARIMGFVLGYGLPGHFGSPPGAPGVGGFSIANALQDLTNTTTWEMNLDCPHMTPPYGCMPTGGRPTKATMIPGHYMTAQIQAPTLEAAQQLTLQAQHLEAVGLTTLLDTYAWFDYVDPVIPGDEWYWLKRAVEDTDFQDVPWIVFDADVDQTPSDAFRFGTHDVSGWDDPRLFSTTTGPRVLAFNLNSWGATTLRSCHTEGGRYVPNALAAGYAAAIGATGEPYCCVAPFPDTLMGSLREGWTLGEAFYLANPYDDWMWTLVGDPFLRITYWFGEQALSPSGSGVPLRFGLLEYRVFASCMTGPGVVRDSTCADFDLDADGDCDLADYTRLLRFYSTDALDENGVMLNEVSYTP